MALSLILNYNLKTDKFYDTEGDVKPEKREEFVSEFLRTQFGAGKDDRKPENRNKYTIKLELDLDGDIYNVSDNCGNKSLRDGILARYLKEC